MIRIKSPSAVAAQRAVAVAAKHWQLFDLIAVGASTIPGFFLRRGGIGSEFVQRVDKMTAGSVGAETDAVVGAAHVRLVLGVAVHVAQFLDAVGELALLPVLADSVLLVGTAQLCLVSGDILLLVGGVGAGGAECPLVRAEGRET